VNRFLPDHCVSHVGDLTPDWLFERNIRALVCDLDNTLVPWHTETIAPDVLGWVESLRTAGIQACIASNTLNLGRLARLADTLRVAHVPANARKPGTTGLACALRLLESNPSSTAMVGDQLFTDMVAGRRMGMTTVLVNPLTPREFIGTRWISRPLERLVLRGENARP